MEAAQLGASAIPIALGGLLAAEDFLEGIGADGVLEEGRAEGAVGGLNAIEDGVEELGLDAGEAADVPVAADDGVDKQRFDGALRTELVVIGAGELLERGGVLAGDDQGLGIGAVLESVETDRGLALDGARPGGVLRVQAVSVDLIGGCHFSTTE